jgi:hypothetical protein
MLLPLHSALQSLMYEYGQIDPLEVEIRFEAPTREWVSSLTRPTISFFLFDLQEKTDLRQTSFETTRTQNQAVRRMAPRRVDLRYMVSALTSVIEDEHQLLWRTLVTLMKYPQLPPEVLPEELRTLEPPLTTRVSQPDDGPRLWELWNGLEMPPRPALLYVVTAPIDLEIAFEAPLVLTRTARYGRFADDKTLAAPETGVQIGGMVRNRRGEPLAGASVAVEGSAAGSSVTNSEGQFTLAGVPSGAVTLRVSRAEGPPALVKVEIPSVGYEITVD